jgi:hypothetical protein
MYQSAVELPSGTVQVKARYRSASGEWSALVDATFTQTGIGLRSGDLNRDGSRDAADVVTMLGAVTNLTAYQTSYGVTNGDLPTIADSNGDHVVSNHDIQALINRLKQESAQAASASSSSSSAANRSATDVSSTSFSASSVTSDDKSVSVLDPTGDIPSAGNVASVATAAVANMPTEIIADSADSMAPSMPIAIPISAPSAEDWSTITEVAPPPSPGEVQTATVNVIPAVDIPDSDAPPVQQATSQRIFGFAIPFADGVYREAWDHRQVGLVQQSIPNLPRLFDKRHAHQSVDSMLKSPELSAVDELFDGWEN